MTPVKRGALTDALARIVRRLQPVDYYAHYECEVVAQGADGMLDLKPTDLRLGEGLKAPIMVPAGQRSVKVLPGAKVLVCFANGDPEKPRALWWQEDASTFTSVEHTATTEVKITGGTDQMLLGTTYRTAETTLNSAIAAALTAIATPVDAVAQLKVVAGLIVQFEAQAAKYLSLRGKVG